MINAPVQIRLLPPATQRLFDFLNYPELNDATGESYLGDDIADGGQALNLMDAKVHRFATAFDNKAVNPQFKTDTVWGKDTGWTIDPGKPGFAVFVGPVDRLLTQIGIVTSGQTYTVIVKCARYTSGTYTPKLGTASDGNITGVGISVHTITANDVDFEMGSIATGDAEFEYIYILHNGDYRFDLPLTSNPEIDFAIIDGHNLLDAFPASLANSMKVHHHSSDAFGSSTEILPSRVVAGLLGKNKAHITLNGVDAYLDGGAGIPGLGNGFTIVLEFDQEDNTPATTQTLFGNATEDEDRTFITLGTDGIIRAGYYDGDWQAPISGPLGGTGKRKLIYAFDGVATSTLEVDGVDIATGASSPAGTSAVDKFVIGSTEGLDQFWAANLYDHRLYNRVLSVPDRAGVVNGDPVAEADKGASQTELVVNGDMSSGDPPDNWLPTRSTLATISGQMRVTATADYGYGAQAVTVVAGKNHALLFSYKNAAGDVAQYQVFDGASDIIARTDLADNTSTTSSGRKEFVSTTTEARLILIAKLNTDITFFGPVSLVQTGLLVGLNDLGLSESQDTWFNDNNSGVDLSLVNVEYSNTSNTDELGFYLMQFDSVLQDLFWYLSINEDNDLPVALQKYGSWLMGKAYLFDISAQTQYSGEMGFSGVDLLETKSGRFDAVVNYEERDRFVIPLAFQSDATWLTFQKIMKYIGGQELPLYMEVLPLNAGDDSVFYRLRLVDNSSPFSYVFGSGVPWRVGLNVLVDL